MRKTLVVALAAAGLAFGAQAAKVGKAAYPDSEIRESTDRAKVAEVERHAAELGAPIGCAMSGSGTSAAAGDTAAKPMHKKGARHHGAKKSGKKASKGQTGDQAGNAPQGS